MAPSCFNTMFHATKQMSEASTARNKRLAHITGLANPDSGNWKGCTRKKYLSGDEYSRIAS